MAAHSSNRTPSVDFDSSRLSVAPKPGSRRARRMAERAAQAQLSTPSADTAEIPVLNRVIVAGGPSYAEKMNFELVTSGARNLHTGRRPRSKNLQLIGTASIAVVAAGIAVAAPLSSVSGPLQLEPAQAATSDAGQPQETMTPSSTISFPVTVDGATKTLRATVGQTYAAAFAQAGISIGARDEISVPLSSEVTDQAVQIVRVTTATVNEAFTDPHPTQRVETNELEVGKEEVEKPGADGQGTRSFTVTYRDGVESSRVLTMETVTQAAEPQVVRVGTRPAGTPAPVGGVSVPANATPVSPGSSRAIAQSMLGGYGWGMDQWGCLDALWQRESGWNSLAMNRSSGAYGIPQALPGTKMASAGADWQTNPATQIAWGLGYISGRYGTPCGAWGHSQSVGWY
ncbi:G5 domain-containing protein [Trueperella sp. LYQ143]|uniref:aggregation-promoting factor C-terminal-like domain-containing protein n=1 Tax=unclassified Trueperella TaxID=2630174 RepID=UPI003983112A